jgi:hypothetical protein
VALRPQQLFQTSFELGSQGSTLHGPKGDQQQSPLDSLLNNWPCRSGNIFPIYLNNRSEKIATETNLAFGLV